MNQSVNLIRVTACTEGFNKFINSSFFINDRYRDGAVFVAIFSDEH